MTSFTEKLDAEALAYFNEVAHKPFNQQAVAFLNAYWPEVGNQAEFIFTVSWEVIKYADMTHKGISLLHLYEEGNDLDFDMGLYFYEQLCKYCEDPKNRQWAAEQYAISQPTMMTAIKRKQELREKVDVNFDGRVSFLEYLLDQYSEFANPADFCKRSMAGGDEHPEIRAARLALEEVNRKIKAYEAERYRLEQESKLPGVKGLKAINELAQLDSGPLAEQLRKALITAEAAVRIAVRKFGGQGGGGAAGGPTEGALWWMSRDLEEKQKRYGKKN